MCIVRCRAKARRYVAHRRVGGREIGVCFVRCRAEARRYVADYVARRAEDIHVEEKHGAVGDEFFSLAHGGEPLIHCERSGDMRVDAVIAHRVRMHAAGGSGRGRNVESEIEIAVVKAQGVMQPACAVARLVLARRASPIGDVVQAVLHEVIAQNLNRVGRGQRHGDGHLPPFGVFTIHPGQGMGRTALRIRLLDEINAGGVPRARRVQSVEQAGQ